MKIRRQIILTIIIVLETAFSFTANAIPVAGEVDSLKRLISIQEDNTDKVNKLLSLARIYTNNNPDSAIFYCRHALMLSKELENTEGIADALFRQCLINDSRGDINSAIRCIKSFLSLSDSLNDPGRMAKGYYYYGILNRKKFLNDTALSCHRKSLRIYMDLKDTLGMYANYNATGIIYKNIVEFDSAAHYYLKALKMCEETGKEKAMGPILNNLGIVYDELEEYDEAREYLHKGLEINEKYDNDRQIAVSCNNLGNVANDLDELEKALSYYQQAEEIYKEIGDVIGLASVYNNLGEVYKKQGKYNQAFGNYNKALSFYHEQDLVEGVITSLKNLADIYVIQGRHKKALILCDSSLRLTIESNNPVKRKDVLITISKIYMFTGDYKKALAYQEWYYELRDSIISIEKAARIAELTKKYENKKVLADNLTLKKENLEKDLSLERRTRQRNTYLFTGLGIIVLILFVAMIIHHKARKAKLIAEHKIRELEEEKKLLAAKSLVEGQEEERKRIAQDLHDGLGVLLSAAKMQFTSIKDTRPENKPLIEKATKLLEQATGDVRKISHNMMPGLLTKLGLYEAVEALLEDVDDTEGIDASAEITGSRNRLPENKEIMLYRIVQEMVNNTLKHAGANNISLLLQVLPDHIDIKYSDNGKGFDVEEKLASEFIGLKSIQSRVNFLNGTVNLESKPGEGTTYLIQIPVL